MHIVISVLVSLFVGLLFGIGLILSGMTDPAKVLGFLDLAGNWDPSLGLVMGGAIAVSLLAFRVAAGRKTSLLGDVMRLPKSTQIDRRLVLGGLAFGAGWGLAGYCPGPALASLASGSAKPIIFGVAMLAGMVIFEVLEHLSAQKSYTSKANARR
ncbi:YeeE/YedE family protein [Actimicrobium antarcticum]|uniref:Membrane protein n=1 Tax=Actimicrobium antarcticum TaxID=1051899 RepID=A0ABP7TRY7_9BURK